MNLGIQILRRGSFIERTSIMQTPRELKNRFPYQFEGRNIGLCFANGWIPEE
jgi:hypothetical protein